MLIIIQLGISAAYMQVLEVFANKINIRTTMGSLPKLKLVLWPVSRFGNRSSVNNACRVKLLDHACNRRFKQKKNEIKLLQEILVQTWLLCILISDYVYVHLYFCDLD